LARYVAAPNPFKGSLGSPAAAAAIARGIRRVHPEAEVIEVPIADGGEGTVEALVAAKAGRLVKASVEGPLGDPVEAAFGVLEGGRAAVVELAAASGLTLVPKELRDPRVTSTFGFGQLLDAARRSGVQRIIAGIGGSATNDGGAGMAQALGFRLLDARGEELERGGAALARLDSIRPPAIDEWLMVSVEVAVDVTNPLCGPEGATRVYGPQKGATSEAVLAELDAALANLARVIARDLHREVADLPGAGAAGGAGAGLVAFLGARLRRGAPLVVEAAGLDSALEGAAAVLTGEGRVDAQTAYGKGPAEVFERARRHRVPAVLLAGSLGAGWESLGWPVHEIGDSSQPGPYREAHAAELLELAAERALRELEG
jgi:glycerate kinase